MKKPVKLNHILRNDIAIDNIQNRINAAIFNLEMHRQLLSKINKTNSKIKKSIMFKKCNIVFSKLCKLQDIKTLENKLSDHYFKGNYYRYI